VAARRWIGLAVVLCAAGAIAVWIAPGGRAPEPPAGEPPGAPAEQIAGAAPPPAAPPPPPPPPPRRAAADDRARAGELVASAPAQAADDRARADELVATARAQAAAGQLARARDLLARAYALDPQPATLLELGRLDLRAGRCRDARRAVQGVLAAAPGPPLADEARALMTEIGRCD